MAQVKDPVCGMMIESESAAGQSTFEANTYYFCTEACKRDFDNDPGSYAGREISSKPDREVELEHHEPPFTKTGGLVAPKFGAAGSGGAEYERLPERHDKRLPDDG